MIQVHTWVRASGRGRGRARAGPAIRVLTFGFGVRTLDVLARRPKLHFFALHVAILPSCSSGNYVCKAGARRLPGQNRCLLELDPATARHVGQPQDTDYGLESARAGQRRQ